MADLEKRCGWGKTFTWYECRSQISLSRKASPALEKSNWGGRLQQKCMKGQNFKTKNIAMEMREAIIIAGCKQLTLSNLKKVVVVMAIVSNELQWQCGCTSNIRSRIRQADVYITSKKLVGSIITTPDRTPGRQTMVQVGLGCPVGWNGKLLSHAASAATSFIPANNSILHSKQKILTTDYFEMASEVLKIGMKNSFSHVCVNVTANAGGFGGLVVSMLASGTRVRGFEPGRSRWIFRVSE